MSIPEIRALAEDVSRSDPLNKVFQSGVLARICELRELMDRGRAHDLAAYLDVAAHLGEYLIAMEVIGPQEICNIQARILRIVEESFSQNAAQVAAVIEEPETTSQIEESGVSMPVRIIDEVRLGDILMQMKLIGQEDLDRALELQKTSGLRIGEALLQLGSVRMEQIQDAMRVQIECRLSAENTSGEDESAVEPETTRAESLQEQREAAAPQPRQVMYDERSAPLPQDYFQPREDLNLVSDILLGDILVRSGKVTQEQVREALRIQRAAGLRLGEALVEAGNTNWQAIQEALGVQHGFRRASQPKKSAM